MIVLLPFWPFAVFATCVRLPLYLVGMRNGELFYDDGVVLSIAWPSVSPRGRRVYTPSAAVLAPFLVPVIWLYRLVVEHLGMTWAVLLPIAVLVTALLLHPGKTANKALHKKQDSLGALEVTSLARAPWAPGKQATRLMRRAAKRAPHGIHFVGLARAIVWKKVYQRAGFSADRVDRRCRSPLYVVYRRRDRPGSRMQHAEHIGALTRQQNRSRPDGPAPSPSPCNSSDGAVGPPAEHSSHRWPP